MATKAIHIILASLIWFSSTGIVLNKHYCQEQLRKVALFISPESCHSDKEAACHKKAKTCCQKKQQDKKKKDDCCKDKSEYLKIDHEQQFSSTILKEIDLPTAPTLAAFSLPLPHSTFGQRIVEYLHYKPPLILRDIPSLFQVYLL